MSDEEKNKKLDASAEEATAAMNPEAQGKEEAGCASQTGERAAAGGVTEPLPRPIDVPATEPAAAKRLHKPTKKQVACGIAAIALVCGLGAAAMVGPRAVAAPGATSAAQTAPEDRNGEEEVRDMLSTLSFAGQDVSVDAADQVDVEVRDGHVMVTQTVPANADAGTMLEQGAKRSAALMAALDGEDTGVTGGMGSATGSNAPASAEEKSAPKADDVTYVVTDPDGKVEVAITNKPSSPAVEEAKKPSSSAGVTDIVKGSDGWSMTDDMHNKLPDSGKVDQAGGNAPTTPAGDKIVPGEKVPEPASPSENAGSAGNNDVGAGDAGGDKADQKKDQTQGDKGSSGPGSQGGQQGAAGSNDSAESPEQTPGNGQGGQPAKEKKWVQDSAAWDEPIYENQPTYGQKWVQDSAAWDEPIYETHSYVYCTGCGGTFSSSEGWLDHNYVDHGGQASCSIGSKKEIVGYKHHEATGHYENVQVGTKKVQVGTRRHEATGHWE